MGQNSNLSSSFAELCFLEYLKHNIPRASQEIPTSSAAAVSDILVEIRNKLHKHIPEAQCNDWMQLLQTEDGTGFLMSLLRVLEGVPYRLLHAILEAAIQPQYWHRLERVITDCCRIAGEEQVSLFLLRNLRSEEESRIIGSIYALHFVRSRIHHVESLFDSPGEPDFVKIGIKYQWTGSKYEFDLLECEEGSTRMNSRELQVREELEDEFFYDRHAALLVAFLAPQKRHIRERIAALLPSYQERYHIRLRPTFQEAQDLANLEGIDLKKKVDEFLAADLSAVSTKFPASR